MSLSDASFETLLRLADNYGVDVPEDITRDDLEEVVGDAVEEWTLEHNRANNHSVRIEETKYDNQAAERPVLDTEREEVELPDSYDENRIVLMLRDPAWAFAYWDLRAQQVAEMQRSDTFSEILLRVSVLEAGSDCDGSVRESFDIPVTLMDNRWYIHLPEQSSCYRIALVARFEDSEEALAVSNVITVPRGMIADNGEKNGSVGDEILAQTGIQDLDLPAEGKRIPQRILDLIDEDLLFN